MTLRDQLAMSALATLSGGSWNGAVVNMIYEGRYDIKHKLAVSAYLMADEMLKVRQMQNLKEGV